MNLFFACKSPPDNTVQELKQYHYQKSIQHMFQTLWAVTHITRTRRASRVSVAIAYYSEFWKSLCCHVKEQATLAYLIIITPSKYMQSGMTNIYKSLPKAGSIITNKNGGSILYVEARTTHLLVHACRWYMCTYHIYLYLKTLQRNSDVSYRQWDSKLIVLPLRRLAKWSRAWLQQVRGGDLHYSFGLKASVYNANDASVAILL